MRVHQAQFAGRYYPDDADRLGEMLASHLLHANAGSVVPKLLIVPHGHYPGRMQVAAPAFRHLHEISHEIKRVVLLGPNHSYPLNGGAVPESEFFATPLGEVPLDMDLVARLATQPWVVKAQAPFLGEYSLEVQLPFLQVCLQKFALVPLMLGKITPEAMSELLSLVWGDKETLVVASIDLSHFQPEALAREQDGVTCHKILALEDEFTNEESCGCYLLQGLLLHCRRKQLKLDL